MNYGINNLYPKPAQLAGAGGATTMQTLAVTSSASFTKWDVLVSLVFVDIQNNDVYVTFDTSVPTATNGHRLSAGTNYTWSAATANVAKYVAVAGTSRVSGSPFQV